VDPRADLDDVVKRKFLTLPGLELRPLGRPARLFPSSGKKHIQMGPTDRASLYIRTQEPTQGRIYKPNTTYLRETFQNSRYMRPCNYVHV
jgi:hypothetical protein